MSPYVTLISQPVWEEDDLQCAWVIWLVVMFPCFFSGWNDENQPTCFKTLKHQFFFIRSPSALCWSSVLVSPTWGRLWPPWYELWHDLWELWLVPDNRCNRWRKVTATGSGWAGVRGCEGGVKEVGRRRREGGEEVRGGGELGKGGEESSQRGGEETERRWRREEGKVSEVRRWWRSCRFTANQLMRLFNKQANDWSVSAGWLTAVGGATAVHYLSVLCGMVGSMDTMAPVESSRDRLVFLPHETNTRLKLERKQQASNAKAANSSVQGGFNTTAARRSCFSWLLVKLQRIKPIHHKIVIFSFVILILLKDTKYPYFIV